MTQPKVLLVTQDVVLARLVTHEIRAWYEVDHRVHETGRPAPRHLYPEDHVATLVDITGQDTLEGLPYAVTGRPIVLLVPEGTRVSGLPGLASACVARGCPPTEIRIAIEEAVAGRSYHSQALRALPRVWYWSGRTPPTPHQLEVLDLKRQRFTNAMISQTLGRTLKSVERDVTHLRRGFGANEDDEPFDWRNTRLTRARP